jgi:hypothetical protein
VAGTLEAEQLHGLVRPPLPRHAVRQRHHCLGKIPGNCILSRSDVRKSLLKSARVPYLVNSLAYNFKLANIDVVDRLLGQRLLSRGIFGGTWRGWISKTIKFVVFLFGVALALHTYLQQVGPLLGDVYVEGGLGLLGGHHEEAAERELAAWRLDARAAGLQVKQRVVEAHVALM